MNTLIYFKIYRAISSETVFCPFSSKIGFTKYYPNWQEPILKLNTTHGKKNNNKREKENKTRLNPTRIVLTAAKKKFEQIRPDA